MGAISLLIALVLIGVLVYWIVGSFTVVKEEPEKPNLNTYRSKNVDMGRTPSSRSNSSGYSGSTSFVDASSPSSWGDSSPSSDSSWGDSSSGGDCGCDSGGGGCD